MYAVNSCSKRVSQLGFSNSFILYQVFLCLKAVLIKKNFCTKVYVKLRGLCEEQEFLDTDYIFRRELLEKGQGVFQGLSGFSSIVLNSKSRVWELIGHQDLNNSVIGIYNGSSSFPLGVKNWFLKFNCNEFYTEFVSKSLKFSQVNNQLKPI